MNNPICNTQFDTRDLEEYREEEEQSLIQSINDNGQEYTDTHNENRDEGTEAEQWEDVETYENILFLDEVFTQPFDQDIEEYEALKDFCEELENYAPDYIYGSQVIHSDYFEEAMDELLEDIGGVPDNLPSYLTIEVDYDALESDYSMATYDSEDYLIR